MNDERKDDPTTNALVVGIDASNLLGGGGRTHLIELLKAAAPVAQGVDRVVVWGHQDTLDLLEDRPWLEKSSPSGLNGNKFSRIFWQRIALSHAVRKAGCHVLFVPGGSYAGNFHPVVTMSRNMLPFQWTELMRFRWSITTLRLILLRLTQTRSFSCADAVIFLTDYAKRSVLQVTGQLSGQTATIPHGLNRRFVMPPRMQKPIEFYSAANSYRLLYVSIVHHYKHQWHVIEAVARLRRATGWPLSLDLVGPAYPPALRRLKASLERFDPDEKWARYHGSVAYTELHDVYGHADLGLFASSCENMPNILVETMAGGLPVACSNRGPMPEILQNAGIYFDPEQPAEIADAIKRLIASPMLRDELAQTAYRAAQEFSWERCAAQTFEFLVGVNRRQYQKLCPSRV